MSNEINNSKLEKIELSIQKKEEELKKYKEQKKAILNREKEKERKARTRRLIQMGAIFEKYLDIHTEEKAEEFCKEYTKISNKNTTPITPNNAPTNTIPITPNDTPTNTKK